MFHTQIPTKWCIERNPRNFEEVNRLFGKMNGKTYKADGSWRTAGGSYRNQDYLCYPHYEGSKYRSKYQPSGYTKINLEQLKNYFMSKESKKIMDKLPENWYVIVTDSILEDAFQWRFNKSIKETTTQGFKPGCIVGMYRWSLNFAKEWSYSIDTLNETEKARWGQEISEEDFRFHVLKKYTREDWIEGRIALLNPDVKDPLLNTFIKECNPKNNNLTFCYENYENPNNKYLVANMDERVIEDYGKGFWKPFTTTDLPIVEDVKELYANENIMKNTEKEVIGYKLIRPEYKGSASLIGGFSNFDTFENFQEMSNSRLVEDYTQIAKKLKAAGVLDIWFEPVYKSEIKLPLINGYNGEDLGESIKYGCAVLEKVWFTTSNNRHIKELTLSSNVKINELQMKEIRKYLQLVK